MADTNTPSTLKREADGTIELSITLPAALVNKTWEEVIEQMVKGATLPGFRQGKAPRKMVEEKLDKEKIREEVLKKVLPQAYIEAVKEHKLNPIINPKIHVEKLDEGKDWQFTAITCEVPEVKLNNYKEEVKKVTAKSKIVIPGKEKPAPSLDEIIKIMIDSVEVAVPGILVEGEVERLLAQLLGEIKSLGLSLEQYLASTNRTVEQLREEYKKKAENDIKFEFALQKIAEEEKISVDAKEIDEALQKAKDENERKQLEANVYLLANILRQQKTLDFLKNL
ncbi:MAG TPA: trigger factor [Patescibacteria group bacterium]